MGRRVSPRRVSPWWAMAAAVLMVAALASTALATSTHAEYVSKVNPICKETSRQAKRIPSRIQSTGRPLIDALRRTEAYRKLLVKAIQRISAVEPAPGEAAQVKAWIKSDRHTVRLIRGFIRAASNGDFAKARALIPKFLKSQRVNRK